MAVRSPNRGASRPWAVRALLACGVWFLFFWWPAAQAAGAPGPIADPASPTGIDSCLACHGTGAQEGLAARRSGRVDEARYRESVHGILPCVRCHEEVTPRHESEPLAPLDLPAGRARRARLSSTCTKCHTGIYAESYAYSFHGTAVRMGDLRAATCADCHGVHDVLRPEDPRSAAAPANLTATCGQSGCHAGAPPGFADGREHILPQQPQGGVVYWVWKFFMALILFDVLKDGPIVMFELLRRVTG
ncbi:hypothetical protein [Caldinitratiruptor microaerophilus]|uniref:Uncharacterized protein n=1 Tax=Caldinitratiruptor microaerophilus TaxID=671077 RepID=A0AA35CNZ6_9FIRM|nr:hypothetical protein [Caldinitratiruptor microaerophilus]BDG62033.1 hypothetical protein caldi_31230 [Caldinitratiruptor microaerophilus]